MMFVPAGFKAELMRHRKEHILECFQVFHNKTIFFFLDDASCGVLLWVLFVPPGLLAVP